MEMDVHEIVNYGIPENAVNVLINRGIKKLNPIQVQALKKGVLDGKNIVVAAPTASGKTLIAELALIKQARSPNIGLYLVPLRALASEKYTELKQWSVLGLKIGITTGDYESPGEYLGNYNIIVATYERFDSILRLKPRWLHRIKVVVIDELHMINDSERGPVLEIIVARLKRVNVQIIGLSATIGNPGDLANWIDAELVYSNWRPIKLIEGAYDSKSKRIYFSDGRIENIIHRLSNSLLSIVLQSITNGYQVLAFVHNRRKTEEYAFELTNHLNLLAHMTNQELINKFIERLRSESPSRNEIDRLSTLMRYGVAYHHAGLSSVARKIVEEAFRERALKAVFATPTLAAGVNLPARRVLVSIKRYDPHIHRFRNIPVFEYKQMAGRAGRPQYDPFGEAIIYDARSKDEAFRKYIHGRIEPIESKLSNERSLRIHTLSLVASGDAVNLKQLIDIYKNTLFYYQYRSTRYFEAEIERIINELMEWDMIRPYAGDIILPTRLGRTVAITYIDPLSAHRFLNIVKREDHGTLYLLHTITLTPDYMRSRPYINYRIVEEFEESAWDDASNELVPEPPEDEIEYSFWLEAYVQARMLKDWINEATEDELSSLYGIGPGDIYAARDTASWIAASLSRVSSIKDMPGLSNRLERLSMRIEYGVREDALELVKLEGIGRVRARTLIKAGIYSLEDLAKAPVTKLLSLPGFGSRIVNSIKEQLKDMGYSVTY